MQNKKFIKPKALVKGDVVATVSLSWGGANTFHSRYLQGIQQFKETFEVKMVEAPNSVKSAGELYDNPQMRLDDLMWAFKNPEVKAVLCNIGGDDTIRLLRFMNDEHFEIIRNNPKIFLGMSDTTINHLMCYKAGLSSFYSACTMFGYAENGGIPDYMIENTKKTLFDNNEIGIIPESDEFIVEISDWGKEPFIRKREKAPGWRYIQGNKTVQGRLIGGCTECLLQFSLGTSLFPDVKDFENVILFLENSEEKISPDTFKYFLRNLGASGILEKLNGIIFGRPGGEFFPNETVEKAKWLVGYEDFDKVLLSVCKEYDRQDLAIITNMDFGHTVPMFILPYGALAEINPTSKTFSILENAVE